MRQIVQPFFNFIKGSDCPYPYLLIVTLCLCPFVLLIRSSTRRAVQGLEPPRLNPGQDPAAYNRDDRRRYPYKSHWQYMRAGYGMIACTLLVVFNGWRSFHPFAAGDFVAAYIGVSDSSPNRFYCH